jgi:hypothetical protein
MVEFLSNARGLKPDCTAIGAEELGDRIRALSFGQQINYPPFLRCENAAYALRGLPVKTCNFHSMPRAAMALRTYWKLVQTSACLATCYAATELLPRKSPDFRSTS